jgi:hypothetical protein
MTALLWIDALAALWVAVLLTLVLRADLRAPTKTEDR